MLNLKRIRPFHWSINKLITANDRIGDTCCGIETITEHQLSTLNVSGSTIFYAIPNSKP